MDINKAIIIGRVGQKPEIKAMPSGTAIVTFAVATTHRYKDKDGQTQERTQWHNIVAYGALAENIGRFVEKGQIVYVEGRMQTDSYEKKDGTKGYSFKIIADTVRFGPRAGGVAPQTQEQEKQEPPASYQPAKVEYPDEDIDPDSIPF